MISVSEGSNGGISYDNIMCMNLIQVSMIYDTLCKRQQKIDRQMRKK